jgi:uncharacterized damage-inducible protein DinB
MINPAHTYDFLTRTRPLILNSARAVTPDDYTREFPIGLGSLARILTHMYAAEHYYYLRLTESPVPDYKDWPIQDEHPPPLAELESAWADQSERTRDALAAVTDWDTPIEFRVDPFDEGLAPRIVTATRAGIAVQILTHEVYHRAQCVNILKQLGQTVEDLDYNMHFWQRRPVER